MPTKQANAIAAAQSLQQLVSRLIGLYDAAQAWSTDYNQNVWDTVWSAMPTVNILADGTPASSNDATPNTAHPINVPVGTPLLISRNDLINAVTLLQSFQNFMTFTTGTIAAPGQSNIKSASLVSPNTVG
jgi:hypothetical protein